MSVFSTLSAAGLSIYLLYYAISLSFNLCLFQFNFNAVTAASGFLFQGDHFLLLHPIE